MDIASLVEKAQQVGFIVRHSGRALSMGFATRKQPKPVRPELVEGPFFPLHGLDDLLGLYDALPGRGFLHRTYGQSFASCCPRSEEHTSELQSPMRLSYAVFCLKNKKTIPDIS